MKSDSAADLPAPGSPPSSRLRSGRPMRHGVAVLVDARGRSGPTANPVGPGHGGAGTDRGSREMIERWASRRVGRIAQDPDLAHPHGGGQWLGRLVDQLGAEARPAAAAGAAGRPG